MFVAAYLKSGNRHQATQFKWGRPELTGWR